MIFTDLLLGHALPCGLVQQLHGLAHIPHPDLPAPVPITVRAFSGRFFRVFRVQ